MKHYLEIDPRVPIEEKVRLRYNREGFDNYMDAHREKRELVDEHGKHTSDLIVIKFRR